MSTTNRKKKRIEKETDKELLSRVTKEMAEPRVVKSARKASKQ